MQLPRMTTRRWMTAVAVVALLMGAGLGVGRRSWRFARLSAHHTNAALEHFGTQMALGGWPPQLQDLSFAELARVQILCRARALVNYHSGLTQKYERAARYPWLPVEPDLPEPE
jgi:hypothetical protein